MEGVPTVPMSLNGYSYAHGNPVTWTDPSGEFLPLLAAVGLGFVLGGGIAGGIELGSQVHHNMSQCGMDTWDALKRLDWRRIGGMALIGGIEGAVMGGLGYGFGAAIEGLGFTGLSAFGMGMLSDVAVGMAWDISVYGDTPTTALIGNVIGFGIGEGIGYSARHRLGFFGGRTRYLEGATGAGGYRYLGQDRYGPYELRLKADYEEIANWGGRDRKRIARSLRIKAKTVHVAHRHMFVDEHRVFDPEIGWDTGRFTPIQHYANLWRNARAGTPDTGGAEEIKWLIAHEYIEAKLMRGDRLPYTSPSAWNLDRFGYWRRTPTRENYGAHDLAPDSEHGDFDHWKDIFGGYAYTGLPLNPSLGNIDKVLGDIRRLRP